ncbi:MAG: hypothetical protein KIT27_07200 [Legionellales bacterium]|nr:hypothetical protein [Legionellales bacterium]
MLFSGTPENFKNLWCSTRRIYALAKQHEVQVEQPPATTLQVAPGNGILPTVLTEFAE